MPQYGHDAHLWFCSDQPHLSVQVTGLLKQQIILIYLFRFQEPISFHFVILLVYFPEVGLCDLLPVCISPSINIRMPDPVFMKLGMYRVFFIYIKLACSRLCASRGLERRLLRSAREYSRWFKEDPVYHGTWPYLKGVLHKPLPSVCLYVYPPFVARKQLGKNVTAAHWFFAEIRVLFLNQA
jgi:hypothetical protein